MLARFLLAVLAFASAGLVFRPAAAQTIDSATIERGHYLAIAGDCASCHTAAKGAAFAGGRPLATPFGTIYSTNITPDPVTGIGNWTANDFWQAIHEGLRKGGAHLYPAMPYPWYTKVTRADSDALYTYLKTVPPADATPPANELLPPLQIRESVAGWNLLFFTAEPFKSDPQKSPAWNRGAYLVEGLGHCGACHTPANVLGAPESGRALQGHAIDHWWAPNLANSGSKAWSADDIVRFLKTGRNSHAVAGGSMAEVVENSTQHMTDTDLAAIAAYLASPRESGKAAATPSVRQASTEVMASGKAIYAVACSACHAADGSGVKGMIPALARNGVVTAPNPVGVLHVILAGGQGNVTQTAPSRVAMPPFDWKLSDAEVAAVASYVRASWGNTASRVSEDAAADLRDALATPIP